MCDECWLAAPPYGGGSVQRLWLDVTLCSDDGRVSVRAWCSGIDGVTRRHDEPLEGTTHEPEVVERIAHMVDDWLAWPCGSEHA